MPLKIGGMALFRPRIEIEPFETSDWQTAMALREPSGEDVFTQESADVAVQAWIPGNGKVLTQGKARSAIYYVLGYAYADDASPWKLHRIPPPGHPVYGPQLRPTQVSILPVSPIGNTDNTNNSPYKTSDVTFENVTRFPTYAKALMNVKFGLRPYYLYADDNPEWSGFEYDRYVSQYEIEPQVEYITAATDRSIVFVDGPANNPYSKPFPGEIGERVSKPNLRMSWWEVPNSFICNEDGIPEKIFDCIGTVNSVEFKGFDPYTLLFEPPVFEKKLYPWYSEDGRAYWWNVHFNFKYFNPPHGASYTVSNDRGWRLVPWRHGGNTSGDVTGGVGWYGARRQVTAGVVSTSDPTIIPESDFARAFEHVSAP